jgi:predicted lipoprotein with Yx(FWY)xxD motif
MIGSLHKRAWLFSVSAVALAILLSACSGGTKGTSQGNHAPAQTASGQPPVSPSAAMGGSGAQIETRSIPGVGTVLVNSEGLTLYHLPTDSSTKTTCTGGCAQVWPPALTTSGNPPSSPGVVGQFGTLTRPDAGVQITFNGMPLYTYIGDSQPGQDNGQGIDGFSVAVAS